MDWREKLPEAFGKKVTSIEDFCKRIEIINNELSRAGTPEGTAAYYRGDRYCAKVQSNLFRKGYLSQESLNFAKWKEANEKKLSDDDFENLMRMQHESNDTRLLDFTTDPLVALRFACGYPGENCRKKVTVFATKDTVLSKEDDNYTEMCRTFMKLVTCEDNDDGIAEILKDNRGVFQKDYFVNAPQGFNRIKRQHGLFLFMGNLKNSDMLSGNPQVHNRKVMHELDAKFGRGPNYGGYIGVLDISPSCVADIRRVLDQTKCYNIDYLLSKAEEKMNKNNEKAAII